jgi:lambda repressor-like predicted transcriptional regulator
MKKDFEEITEKYAAKIAPHLDLAKKAYGLRGQATPAHKASTKYTELVKEYYAKGGSLVALAEKLGVAYSGLRRRVFTSAIPPVARKNRSRASEETIAKAMESILKAREVSTEDYHQELHKAYHEGISLATVSKALGLSSSAPLYYAVQRHETRLQEAKSK